MPDISASVGSSLVTGLLASLNYPFVLRFEDRAFIEEARATDVDVKIGERQPSAEPDLDALERGDLFLDTAIEAYVRAVSKSGGTEGGEEFALLKTLFEGFEIDRARPEEESRRKLHADIEAGDQEVFSKRFGEYLRGIKFSVRWVEVEVSARPDSTLGNPIRVQNLRLKVRAKVEACIKVFGKKYCATATSPWMTLEGREAAVELLESGLRVRAEARVSDIDIVIRIKIWKWHYDIRIGVTGIVNGFLSKQAPTVLDLSKMELPIPRLGRIYRPQAVDVPAHASTTTINIDGSFSPS